MNNTIYASHTLYDWDEVVAYLRWKGFDERTLPIPPGMKSDYPGVLVICEYDQTDGNENGYRDYQIIWLARSEFDKPRVPHPPFDRRDMKIKLIENRAVNDKLPCTCRVDLYHGTPREITLYTTEAYAWPSQACKDAEEWLLKHCKQE